MAAPALSQPISVGVVPERLAAMVLYVAEKAGRFLPSDAAGRARVHEWLFHVATDVSPTSSSIYYLSNQLPERPTAAIRLFEDRLARFLRNIDHRLGQVEFLAGALSVADLTFFPNYLARRSTVEELGGLTHLRRWADQMAARPAVERMMKIG
jgi:glutathione S-transferase